MGSVEKVPNFEHLISSQVWTSNFERTRQAGTNNEVASARAVRTGRQRGSRRWQVGPSREAANHWQVGLARRAESPHTPLGSDSHSVGGERVAAAAGRCRLQVCCPAESSVSAHAWRHSIGGGFCWPVSPFFFFCLLVPSQVTFCGGRHQTKRSNCWCWTGPDVLFLTCFWSRTSRAVP